MGEWWKDEGVLDGESASHLVAAALFNSTKKKHKNMRVLIGNRINRKEDVMEVIRAGVLALSSLRFL